MSTFRGAGGSTSVWEGGREGGREAGEVEGRGGQALSRSDCLRVDQCFHPVLSAALHQDKRKGPTLAFAWRLFAGSLT